ncbi:protein trichome birefringence-like [Ranunculus cassubicifolius]
MVKAMRFGWNLPSITKHNHLLRNFAISISLMGIALLLLYSAGFSLLATPTQISSEISELELANAHKEEKCDIFSGDWIPNLSPLIYTNNTCSEIQGHQNCIKNGRPDSGYIYWKWRPHECDLPRFDAERFLNQMRNKSWGFIGDSITRNHVQSLVCILSSVEEAVEIYHNEEWTSKTWKFPTFNFTLAVIWSPLLVKAGIFEDSNGVSSSEIQLHLDEIDEKWTSEYTKFDYVVIAGGKWFTKTAIHYENKTVITGCQYEIDKPRARDLNLTEFRFDYAYRKAIRIVLNFIATSEHNVTVLFRTFTPDHFENGRWFSGGTCKRTIPFKDGEIDFTEIDSIMRNVELEEFEKAVKSVGSKGATLRLVDTSRMSLLRPDGHPGPYRQFQPFAEDENAKVQNDCLHWCLPGPIDSWNDLIMQIIQDS